MFGDKLLEWAEEHPKLLLIVSAITLAAAVENYVEAAKFYDSVTALKASEALGG